VAELPENAMQKAATQRRGGLFAMSALALAISLAGCDGDDGATGPAGAPGADGTDGAPGASAAITVQGVVQDGPVAGGTLHAILAADLASVLDGSTAAADVAVATLARNPLDGQNFSIQLPPENAGDLVFLVFEAGGADDLASDEPPFSMTSVLVAPAAGFATTANVTPHSSLIAWAVALGEDAANAGAEEIEAARAAVMSQFGGDLGADADPIGAGDPDAILAASTELAFVLRSMISGGIESAEDAIELIGYDLADGALDGVGPTATADEFRTANVGTIAVRSVAAAANVNRPLSSLVAVRLTLDGFDSIKDYVKSLAATVAAGLNPPVTFPLEVDLTDTVRVIGGLESNVVVAHLEPMTPTRDADAPFFGANNDYLSFMGDGWDADWSDEDEDGDPVVGSAPQFNGAPGAGFIWSNFEYVSNSQPRVGIAPDGQHLTIANQMVAKGLLDLDPSDDAAWDQAAVDSYIAYYKRNIGGGWMRLEQAPEKGPWKLVPTETSEGVNRFDSTSGTLSRVVGYSPVRLDIDDAGDNLPLGVVSGILADCSGGTTPWGTIITAEENAQGYYGDLETAFPSSSNQFEPGTDWARGQDITLDVAMVEPQPAFSYSLIGGEGTPGRLPGRHDRDVYGFLVEMDVNGTKADGSAIAPDDWYGKEGLAPGAGHLKLGAFGRARWENVTIVTGDDWELIDGQPIVMYSGNDRRSGRVYKWVSSGVYVEGMTKSEVRALLEDGDLYVAHFEDMDNRTGITKLDTSAECNAMFKTEAEVGSGAEAPPVGDWKESVATVLSTCTIPTPADPVTGTWIRLSVDNDDQVAPNADAMVDFTSATAAPSRPALAGAAGTTVGQALRDQDWNNIGAFQDDNTLYAALFTAGMKLGVMETNRPEDLEWSPQRETLYIAFTNSGRPTVLDQDGVMFEHYQIGTDGSGNAITTGRSVGSFGRTGNRRDVGGSIFALEETGGTPGTSTTFEAYAVWYGSQGTGPYDVANVDNMMIDSDGDVWFGTDGNVGTNGHADALYYLDLDSGLPNPVYGSTTLGIPYRVIAGPSDSEATGPAWNPDETTVFFNVQHPGENLNGIGSVWPFNQR
jgi:secreted PhoX family phosphatase